jgi:hypothetical protein
MEEQMETVRDFIRTTIAEKKGEPVITECGQCGNVNLFDSMVVKPNYDIDLYVTCKCGWVVTAFVNPDTEIMLALIKNDDCPDPLTEDKDYNEYLKTFKSTGIDTVRD